ncbi:uncharacterized [Tachysurus ichikawai]
MNDLLRFFLCALQRSKNNKRKKIPKLHLSISSSSEISSRSNSSASSSAREYGGETATSVKCSNTDLSGNVILSRNSDLVTGKTKRPEDGEEKRLLHSCSLCSCFSTRLQPHHLAKRPLPPALHGSKALVTICSTTEWRNRGSAPLERLFNHQGRSTVSETVPIETEYASTLRSGFVRRISRSGRIADRK